MKLAELTGKLPGSLWTARPDVPGDLEVVRLTWDSREVLPGDLFFALPGGRVDGRAFLPAARERGARAAVVEGEPHPAGPALQLQARGARTVLGLMAALFYGQPSQRLRLCGITGTDGKTSCTWIARHVLASTGRRAVAAGTPGVKGDQDTLRSWDEVAGRAPAVEGGAGEAAIEAHRRWQPTTPEAPVFQAALRTLVCEGVEDVICEVSSHALVQERVLGSQFAVVALTHVSRDHLDFHGSARAYRAAKARLFSRELRGGPLESGSVTAVLNVDDPLGRELAGRVGQGLLTVGHAAPADLRVTRAAATAAGTSLELLWRGERLAIEAPLVGRFQIENLAVSAGICLALGLSPEETARGMRTLEPVPGRFEAIRAGQPFAVIVDYAHTPDALAQALLSARDITSGDLIVVFGCGGDRDRRKRPAMGAAAARYADRVILTSDNPRSEEPEAILAMIAAGAAPVTPQRIVDRAAAIEAALRHAGPGDTVIIAGRGAEALQLFGDRVECFDDRAVARAILARIQMART